jgi:hypothetical protein
VGGLHSDPSSKDLRSGPVAMMYIHRDGGVEVCAARGGWMVDDVLEKKTGALVFYLTVQEVAVIQGGRILSGHKNIERLQTEPKLVFMNASNSVMVGNFIFRLFSLNDRHSRFTKDLKYLLRTCFATFLLWLREVTLYFNYVVYLNAVVHLYTVVYLYRAVYLNAVVHLYTVVYLYSAVYLNAVVYFDTALLYNSTKQIIRGVEVWGAL